MFMDETRVKRVTGAKYLGVLIQERDNTDAEINQRIKATTIIWKNWESYGK